MSRSLAKAEVVVTGGAGFIGSHLVDAVAADGASSVTVLDDLSLGDERNLADARRTGVALERVDCSDPDAVAAVLGGRDIDVCFNLAVIPLPASLDAPKQSVDRNVQMTTVFAELLRAGSIGTLVQFSSSEVYGTVTGVAREDDPHAPETPYAASKSATDAIAASYHRTFDLDVVVVRPFNNYGPRQNAGAYAGLIPAVLARVAAGEPVLVFGDGEQTRDYLYVGETARGTITAFERLPGDGRPVNLASGKERSVNQVVAATLHALERPDWPVRHVAERPGDVRRQRADVERAAQELGFRESIDFPDGIARTVDWYRAVGLV